MSGIFQFAHALTDTQLDAYILNAPASDSLNKLLIMKEELSTGTYVSVPVKRPEYKDSFDIVGSVYKFQKDYNSVADASSGYIRDVEFSTEINKTLISGWKTASDVLFAVGTGGASTAASSRISPNMVLGKLADLVTSKVESIGKAEVNSAKEFQIDVQQRQMIHLLNETMNRAIRSNPLLSDSPPGKRVEAMLKMSGTVASVMQDSEFLSLLDKADPKVKDTFLLEFTRQSNANNAELFKWVQKQLNQNVKGMESLQQDVSRIQDKLLEEKEIQKLNASEYTYQKFAQDFAAIANLTSQLGGFFVAAGKMSNSQAKIVNAVTNSISGTASVCMAVSAGAGPVGIAVAAIGAVVSILGGLFSRGGDGGLAVALQQLSKQIDDLSKQTQKNFDEVFRLLSLVIKQQELTYKAIIDTQKLIKNHNQQIAVQMERSFRILMDNAEINLQTGKEILEYLKLGECKTFLNNIQEKDGNDAFIYLKSEESPFFKSYEARQAHFKQNQNDWLMCRNKINDLYTEALKGVPSSLLLIKPNGIDKTDDDKTPGDLSKLRSDRINSYRFLKRVWDEKLKSPKESVYSVGQGARKMSGPFSSWWLKRMNESADKVPDLLTLPSVLLDPHALVEVSGYAMMIEPYFELTRNDNGVALYTPDELLKNPIRTEWNMRGKYLILKSLKLLEQSLIQQALLAGDLILPELVKIFSNKEDPRRDELIYHMTSSESLSKNVIAGWILEQEAALRLKLIAQLRSDDKSGLADAFGSGFVYDKNLNRPKGFSLISVKFYPPAFLKSDMLVANLALPEVTDLVTPQFMMGPAVRALLEERSEVQKRILSYDRSNYNPEIKKFINEQVMLRGVAP